MACANNVVLGSSTVTYICVFSLSRHSDGDVRTLHCAYPCWLLLFLLSFVLSFFFPSFFPSFFLSFFFPFFFLLSLHQKYSNIFSLIYSAGNRAFQEKESPPPPPHTHTHTSGVGVENEAACTHISMEVCQHLYLSASVAKETSRFIPKWVQLR